MAGNELEELEDLTGVKKRLESKKDCFSLAFDKNKGKSLVWKYFGRLLYKDNAGNAHHVLQKRIVCSLCIADIKNEKVVTTIANYGEETSTHSMLAHLKKFHAPEIGLSSGLINQSSQKTLTSYFTEPPLTKSLEKTDGQINSSPVKLSPHERMARSCARLYASMGSFRARFFENDSFREFMNSACNKAVWVPSRNTILKYVETIYKEDKAAIIDYLSKQCSSVITISFDLWTDSGPLRQSFLNMQLQFSNDFVIYNINLATLPFTLKKTGENLAVRIKDILTEFGLLEKFIIFVTDKGSNCLRAIRILIEQMEIKGMGMECLAHGLHNLISNDIFKDESSAKEMLELLKKLRTIRRVLQFKIQDISETSKYFNTMKGICLLTLEDHDDTDVLSYVNGRNELIKNNNTTRWNSTYNMLSSFKKSISAVNQVLISLSKRKLCLTENDKDLINDLVETLKVFKDVSKLIQGKEISSIGSIVLCKETILSKLSKVSKLKTSVMKNEIIPLLKTNLEKRFPVTDLHVLAALLDPCMRSEMIKKMTVSEKFEMIGKFWNKFNLGQLEEMPQVTENKSGKLNVAQKFRSRMIKKNSRKEMSSMKNVLGTEIGKFLELTVDHQEVEVFWSTHKSIFPKLYLLASVIYGIPTSSASSESAFSVAGNHYTKQNCHLDPGKVNFQCFISLNRKFLQKIDHIPKPERKRTRKTKSQAKETAEFLSSCSSEINHDVSIELIDSETDASNSETEDTAEESETYLTDLETNSPNVSQHSDDQPTYIPVVEEDEETTEFAEMDEKYSYCQDEEGNSLYEEYEFLFDDSTCVT